MKELFARLWENLGDRVGGPMTLRIILQPAMARLLADRAGLQDAREERPPYFWALLTEPTQRTDLLREGWTAIVRVFVLNHGRDQSIDRAAMDLSLVGLIVAALLAVVPYLLIRGPVNRITRRWRRKECLPRDG